MREQRTITFPRRTGKTFEQQRRIAAALLEGQQVFLASPGGGSMMSLAADGVSLISTPLPAPDPTLWRFDGTTGEYVNVADPRKRMPGLYRV